MINDYRYIFTSTTRIMNAEETFMIKPIPRADWKSGDYVVVEVVKIGGSSLKAELTNGRMMELMRGDLLVGALGIRHATLEATGSWQAVGSDGRMHLLTGAGLLGKMTSRSIFITSLIEVNYQGHLHVNGQKRNMLDYVADIPNQTFQKPIILFVGTSMSSGKTTSARIATRQLKEMGLKVGGAKLTGAGRYRDILTVKDAGADVVYDFVDAGLPSSICSKTVYRKALHQMLSMLAAEDPDVAVIEIGASPLEPYNGDMAIKAIRKQVRCTVLCASDPYSVLGVMKSFKLKPTIVSGPAANTLGGIDLIKKLCNIDAINLIRRENLPVFKKILRERLDLSHPV